MNELEFLKDFDLSLLYIALGLSLFFVSILASISLRRVKSSETVQEKETTQEKITKSEIEEIKVPVEQAQDVLNLEIEKEIAPVASSVPIKETKSKTDSSLFERLKNTSFKFTNSLKLLSNKKNELADTYLDLEELLIEADVGVNTSGKLITLLKESLNSAESDKSTTAIKRNLKEIVKKILQSDTDPEIEPEKVNGLPKIVLVVGVNGAGKTTSIGKLAFQFRAQGANVLVAACDTFRAAASDQLKVWVERAGAELEAGADGEKPSTVAFRAVTRAKNEGFDILLIDTAGRLHTKQNLMQELGAVTKIISRECENAPHETILVVDGSSGQNALHQAKEFNEVTTLTGIIITKLDGTPRGGVVIGIKNELNIPIRYIGLGESTADLRIFDATEFTDALFYTEEREEINYLRVND